MPVDLHTSDLDRFIGGNTSLQARNAAGGGPCVVPPPKRRRTDAGETVEPSMPSTASGINGQGPLPQANAEFRHGWINKIIPLLAAEQMGWTCVSRGRRGTPDGCPRSGGPGEGPRVGSMAKIIGPSSNVCRQAPIKWISAAMNAVVRSGTRSRTCMFMTRSWRSPLSRFIAIVHHTATSPSRSAEHFARMLGGCSPAAVFRGREGAAQVSERALRAAPPLRRRSPVFHRGGVVTQSSASLPRRSDWLVGWSSVWSSDSCVALWQASAMRRDCNGSAAGLWADASHRAAEHHGRGALPLCSFRAAFLQAVASYRIYFLYIILY